MTVVVFAIGYMTVAAIVSGLVTLLVTDFATEGGEPGPEDWMLGIVAGLFWPMTLVVAVTGSLGWLAARFVYRAIRGMQDADR